MLWRSDEFDKFQGEEYDDILLGNKDNLFEEDLLDKYNNNMNNLHIDIEDNNTNLNNNLMSKKIPKKKT